MKWMNALPSVVGIILIVVIIVTSFFANRLQPKVGNQIIRITGVVLLICSVLSLILQMD